MFSWREFPVYLHISIPKVFSQPEKFRHLNVKPQVKSKLPAHTNMPGVLIFISVFFRHFEHEVVQFRNDKFFHSQLDSSA